MTEQENTAEIVWHRITEFFSRRKVHYMRTFNQEGSPQAVLLDLIRFCKVYQPIKSTDPYFNAVMEGRREVGLRILNYLNLPSDQLAAMSVQAAKSELEDGR
jgi:hypothetical protein